MCVSAFKILHRAVPQVQGKVECNWNPQLTTSKWYQLPAAWVGVGAVFFYFLPSIIDFSTAS